MADILKSMVIQYLINSSAAANFKTIVLALPIIQNNKLLTIINNLYVSPSLQLNIKWQLKNNLIYSSQGPMVIIFFYCLSIDPGP